LPSHCRAEKTGSLKTRSASYPDDEHDRGGKSYQERKQNIKANRGQDKTSDCAPYQNLEELASVLPDELRNPLYVICSRFRE
jgi:hypothetical protein